MDKSFFSKLSRYPVEDYLQLMRFDKPIGVLLLLWPTLWSLWLAASGIPSWKNLSIFILGVIVTRAAGCIINDFADRKVDIKVKRTANRPLTTGKVSIHSAFVLFSVLIIIAFVLVLMTNKLTLLLSLGALLLLSIYPFMKRYTYFPQVVLGAAFSWSTIMAFSAETGHIVKEAWLIFITVTIWTVCYDTFYAMVDEVDDRVAGIKSTAILFGDNAPIVTAFLQLFVVFCWIIIGYQFSLGTIYYCSIIVAAMLFAYQQWLVSQNHTEAYFKAFLNNNWVGATLFLGIAFDLGI